MQSFNYDKQPPLIKRFLMLVRKLIQDQRS